MERIQLAGFNDIDQNIRKRVNEIVEQKAARFDHMFPEYTLGLHLKGLHKVGNTPKDKPPKEKYELKVHVKTPEKTFTVSDTEWDLVKLTHSTLDSITREIEHHRKK